MIKKILTAVIIGDALGSAVDGLTRGHIHAHFRNINDYIDPEPALKNKIEMWRKPGLYSSMTQFMLILAMTCSRRRPCVDNFRQAVATSPEIPGYDYGIFRYPDAIEREFILRMKDSVRNPQTPEQPCARIIPALTFLSFRNNSPLEHIMDIIAVVRLFTLDLSTLAAALIYSSLLRTITADGNSTADPLHASHEEAMKVADTVESNSAGIFAQAVNPGSLMKELHTSIEMLSEIMSADTLKAAEDRIISHVNRRLKTPVTRATVNLPAALFPYALAVCSFPRNSSSPLFFAASEGGSAAVLTALTGAIVACRHDAAILPDMLIRNLVNRKKVLALVDALCRGATPPGLLDDFIRSETSLTAKEQDDLRARLKHAKKKPKKIPLSQAGKEKQLARHAVESWTKYDKARWRKERQHNDKNDES